MVYVDGNGTVRDRRPIWTPSGFYYLLMSFVEFIVLFFRSLTNPTLTKHGSNMEPTHYRTGRGGGGGGGGGGSGGGGRYDRPPEARPRRRMGGFGGAGAGPGCTPMSGG